MKICKGETSFLHWGDLWSMTRRTSAPVSPIAAILGSETSDNKLSLEHIFLLAYLYLKWMFGVGGSESSLSLLSLLPLFPFSSLFLLQYVLFSCCFYTAYTNLIVYVWFRY